MARSGRPSALTPEVQAKVVSAIQGGNYRCAAARWAGVSMRTFSEWLKRGAAAKSGPHRDFLLAVQEAESQAEIRAVALVMKAAAEDPKHAQWWLERKFPQRWGRKDRMEHSTGKGKPLESAVTINWAEMTQRRDEPDPVEERIRRAGLPDAGGVEG